MEIHDDYKTIYDEIEIDDRGNKLINDVINEPKSFGFHIANRNMRIAVVLIKRALKRRGKLTNYVLKKKFKSTINDIQPTKTEVSTAENRKDYVQEIKTIDPKEFTGDREWCWKEFERHIGIPKRWDVHPSAAISYIRLKKYMRYVPEARSLKKPHDIGSVFLASDEPMRCLCPDHQCLCVGDLIINKRMKIPENRRPRWHPLRYIEGLLNVFEKKSDVSAFIEKLSDFSSASTEKKEQKNNNMLSQDICIKKCRLCLVSEKAQYKKYIPSFGPRKPEPVAEKKMVEVFEKLEEDDRICNVVFCTVSTQTDNGPDGELLTGQSINFTHVLFANNEETYLSDIRGAKLQITHYTCVSPKGPDMQVCVKNMEKLLDFKEMKARLSKFISSIYEIKDPGIPVRNSSTQVPWRKRICESLKPRSPDRCYDEDYDNLPKVPWHWRKMHAATWEDMKKEEEFVEDDTDDICSCCELYMESGIDKEALLEDMRNILSLPGDVTITKDELIKDENISDVTTIIEEVIANTFDDIDENIKKDVVLIEAGNEGYEANDNKKIYYITQEKDNTEGTNEGIEDNMLEIDKEMEKNEIINENRNDKESVNKNIPHTMEFITANDNYENMKKDIELIEAGNEGYEQSDNQKIDHTKQEKDNTEGTNEGIENNMLEIDKEMEKNEIINENRNDKESVNKNIPHTMEFITANDNYENMKIDVELIEAGNEGYEESDNQKIDHIKQEKDNIEGTNEGIENNTLEIDKEMDKDEIINENRNDKENADKNIPDTKEFIIVNDNSKLNELIDAGKASDKITTDEIGNNKKRGKCKKIRSKKSFLLSCSKTREQKLSVPIEINKNSEDMNATDEEINNSKTHIENDNNLIGFISETVLQRSDDQLNQELSKDLSSNSKLNKKSGILKKQKVTSNIQNTSDKIVLRLKTSDKKASSAFSSLFKWLYGQPIKTSEFNKTSPVKSVPKDKYSIDETKLNEKDSKNSEKEVFSIRYTSSSISVNKSTSSGA